MMFRRNRPVPTPEDMPLQTVQPEQRLGYIALRGDNGHETFADFADGLKKDLENFGNNWEVANLVIGNYVDDPTNRENLVQTITEYSSHSDDHANKSRRRNTRLAEKDFSEFVNAHVLLARYEGTLNIRAGTEIAHAGGGMREVIAKGRSVGQGAALPRSRWEIIVGTACEHTPTAQTFYSSLTGLSTALRPVYKAAAKAEVGVITKLEKYIWKGPDQAMAFVNSLEELAASEEANDQLLLHLIAANTAIANGNSLVEYAMSQVEVAAASGAAIDEFLFKKGQEDQGQNWINFTRGIFEQMNQDKRLSFADYLQRNQETWPVDFATDYDQFVRDRVKDVKQHIAKLMKTALDPQLITPSLYETEATFDRLMRQVGATPMQWAQMQDRERKLVELRRGMATKLPNETVTTPETEKQRLKPVMLRLAGGYYHLGEEAELAEVIEDLVSKKPGDASYKDDLYTMIQALIEKPFRPGTEHLKDVRDIKIEGSEKKYRVQRFNPVHASGISFGKGAKESRIIFTLAERKLGIIAMLGTHRDYEQFIKKMQGR